MTSRTVCIYPRWHASSSKWRRRPRDILGFVTLGELARRLDCPVEGDAAIEIRRVAKIEDAGPGDLTFLANPKYVSKLAATKASAVIMNGDVALAPCAIIRSKSPYLTFARAAQVLAPVLRVATGIHALASTASDAVVDATASVGPFAVIGSGATIGARTVVHPHVVIGEGAIVGADCVLHAHVSVRERCVLGDRVVLQNGHGVVVGKHALLAAQVGIAGSTTLGDQVMFGGQVGVGGHLTIGDRVKAVGQTGITNSVDADTFVSGYPAIENGEWRRSSVVFRKLPELRRQLR